MANESPVTIPLVIVETIGKLNSKLKLSEGESEIINVRISEEIADRISIDDPEAKDFFLERYGVGFLAFDVVQDVLDDHLIPALALMIATNDDLPPITEDEKIKAGDDLVAWINNPDTVFRLERKLLAARKEDKEIAKDLGWNKSKPTAKRQK